MPRSSASGSVAEKARRVYDEKWRALLEADHAGEVVAVEPESGDYVLGRNLLEITSTHTAKFGDKQVYIFRVGGGGAVKIGGAFLNGRISG